MTARLRSWWQQMKQHPVATGVAVVLVFILFIFLAYRFGWDWTGFNSGASQIAITSTSKGNYTATISQPSKSLWDWLQLLGVLAIPVVVGLGAAWFTAQQGKVSDRENKDNQREAALQGYIDKMSEFLLDKDKPLRESKPEDEVRKIARMRTITILKQLNAQRIGYVFTFLREAGLMTTTSNDNVVSLSDADLRAVKWAHADLFEANLYWAVLTKADLSRAYLRRVCLSRAILNEADLTRAYLNEANLRKAILSGTILAKADLTEANFTGADLSSADLRGADLRGANFVDANLGGAKLKGARYNRERVEKLDALRRPVREAFIEPTQWPQGFNPQAAGATVDGIDLHPYQF